MEFNSPNFLISFIIFMVLFNLKNEAIYRKILLLIANIVFIGSFATSILHAIPLFTFILLGYILVRLIRIAPNQNLMFLFIAILVLVFMYLKNYFVSIGLPGLSSSSYLLIGLSYILFRILHLIIDLQNGAIDEDITITSYLNYTCFFLSFVSGPIQRYQDFMVQLHGSGLNTATREEIYTAFSRIITGFFKVLYLSVLLLEAHQANWQFANIILPGYLALIIDSSFSIAIYTFYMYFNFSGYMDIVIGFGRLIGITLPENFNRPFWAENFLDLWARWHITLSEWFRIYFFNPLLKMLKYWLPDKAFGPYLAVISFFITFMVLGIWHGSTMIFFFEGLLFGIGASLNKLYQLQAKKWLHKDGYNRLKKSIFYGYLCRGLTFSYVSIALICLYLNAEQLDRFLSLGVILGMIFLLSTFTIMTVSIIPIMWLLDRMIVWFRITQLCSHVSQSLLLGNAWLAFKLIILVCTLVLLEDAAVPKFIYQGF